MRAGSKIQSRILGASLIAFSAIWAACSFPEHTFIEDGQFYGTTDSGVGGSVGGSGGVGATGGGATGGVGATGGGATGGVGATGGGATGGTAGAGTGGGTGNEDCTNGVDDDGDNKVDCQDSDCTSEFTCVPVPPSGWTGPVVVFSGAGTAPGCLSPYPTLKENANAGVNLGNPTCPTCTCDPATGATCSGDVIVFDGANCTGASWGPPGGGPTKTLAAGSTCQLLPPLCFDATGKPTSAVLSNVQITGGSCNPKTTGTKNIPAATFDKSVRACGDPPGGGKGCGASVCMPKPSSEFNLGICIYKTGDTSCPGGAFSKKNSAYHDITETRDCSACGCNGASGGSCASPVATLYTNDVCSANAQAIAGEGTCIGLTADPDTLPNVAGCGTGGAGTGPAETRSGKFSATASGATCPPTGGQITGSATPSDPLTFCCL